VRFDSLSSEDIRFTCKKVTLRPGDFNSRSQITIKCSSKRDRVTCMFTLMRVLHTVHV